MSGGPPARRTPPSSSYTICPSLLIVRRSLRSCEQSENDGREGSSLVGYSLDGLLATGNASIDWDVVTRSDAVRCKAMASIP